VCGQFDLLLLMMHFFILVGKKKIIPKELQKILQTLGGHLFQWDETWNDDDYFY
jgi:hypothetical protein